MTSQQRSSKEEEVDRELLARGEQAIEDFGGPDELIVPAKERESKLISIRLPIDMMQELRAVASHKGDIGYQRLIKRYITAGLLHEKRNLQAAASPSQGISYFIVISPNESATATSDIPWEKSDEDPEGIKWCEA